MAITINGSGTITGISAGGLPDDSVTASDIADGAVTPAKLSGTLGSGTSTQVLQSDGDGTFSWADAGGGYTLASYEEFTESGTWNKTGNANVYEIHCVGGGGSGGSLSTSDSNSCAIGGGGGGGAVLRINAADLSASYAVTVGAGGSNTTANTSFGNGNAGGASSFGNIVVANGGAGGTYSSNTTINNRSSGGTGSVNVTGNYSATEAGQNSTLYNSTGGTDNGVSGGGGFSGSGGRGRGYVNGSIVYVYAPTESTTAAYKYQASAMSNGSGGHASTGSSNGGDGVVRVFGYEE